MLIARSTGARVGASHPLQRHSALQHPRGSLFGSRHGLIRKKEKRSSDNPLRALAGSPGPVREPEEPHKAHEGARQLLGVSALAFFSFLAVVAKDRVTSPIIPPLLPTLTASASDAGSTKPEPVRAIVENPNTSTPVKNRRLLRAVWGMATAPVKLVDSLLFPEEALVGSKAQQEPAPPAVSTSAPAPKQPSAGRHAATATADSISAAVPEAAPAAAVAGEALVSLSRQVDALASTVPEAPAAVSPATSTTPDFLVQLQEAVARLVSQQQQASAQDKAAQCTDSSADAAAALATQDADSSADAAAALAALRMLVGPDAMSLLPVLLVTAATAAAGLMLAAAMAGVAGLVDKRQAMTPAQRAAQAALLDSPLRPIVCQTWPGFLPMLPSSIEPSYYRWRDTDGPAAAPGGSPTNSSSSSSVSGAAAAASAVACGPKEHPLDQEWWSFAQIQALRLMPELTGKSRSGRSGVDSTAASKAPTSSSSSSSAAAGTATAADATKAAPAAAAATAAVPPTPARSFEDTKDSLYQAARAAARGDTDLSLAVVSSSTDGSVLLGEAWELAVQLATVDSLASPDTAWTLTHGFGAGAPTQLLAEVCCLLPAAVVAVRAGAKSGSPDWQAGSISCWEQASLLVCMLLDPATSGVGRLQAVCEAMGVVGTAAAPDVLQGVLQERCLHLVQQTAEAEAIPDLTYGHVPGVEAFLQRGKQRRVEFVAAALHSSIMAASVAAELSGEAVGEQAASAGSPSPAASTEGVAWEQPRLLLRHAQLLHDVLRGLLLPPKDESLGRLAAELLDVSNPATRQQGPQAQRLLDMQAEPPGGVGFKALADAALHKEIHALASAPLLLEAALRPVSAVAWSREDDVAAEAVVEAVGKSLRAVKLPETAPLFQLRPQWPAAQQLAIMDSMLLPSAMANLLYLFTECFCMLPGTLALLPAAVVNVRSFLDQKLAAVAQHSGGQANREDATGACLRMYRYLFVTVAQQRGDANFFPEVLRMLGLDLAAVAAAVHAVQAGQSVNAAAGAAAAAARGPVMQLAGPWLLPDLPCSSDSRLDSAARPPLALSCAVCLSLLLHLGSTERWLDVEDWDPAASQQPSSDSHMPPAEACASLALLAAQFARSSVFKAPGSDAAAAVLLALLEQLQRAPGARASSRFSAQTSALLQAGQRSTGVSKVVVFKDSWAAGMAAALVLPEGMDLGGDERWLELQDYSEVKDNGLLPASMLGDGDEDERQLLLDIEEQEEADANADAAEADSERRRLSDGSSDEEEAEGWREEEEEGSPSTECSNDEEKAEGWQEEEGSPSAECSRDEEEAEGWQEEEDEGSPSAEESSGADWEAEAAQALQGVSDHELVSGLVALEGYCERLLAAGLVTVAAERARSWTQDSAPFGIRVAFDAAVFTAGVAVCAGEEVAAEKLRELSRTAPTWALVEVCRLLPQGVRHYHTTVADTHSAPGEVSSDGSWGLAARLMAAVLRPAAAPGGADAQGASREGQAAEQVGSGDGQAPGQQQSQQQKRKQQKRKQKKKQQRKDRQAMLVEAAQLEDEGPEPAASANGRVSEQEAAVAAVELLEGKEAAGPDCELIPTVKKLLGLAADPADSAPSSGDVMPNRLALLLCQAMLMRGDDAQAKLQAAVGYLAAAHTPGSEALQLPCMLSNCMEALFSSEDWESPTGSARQVLSSLSGALPWQPYISLQKQLMAKGLIRELEVPAEFE